MCSHTAHTHGASRRVPALPLRDAKLGARMASPLLVSLVVGGRRQRAISPQRCAECALGDRRVGLAVLMQQHQTQGLAADSVLRLPNRHQAALSTGASPNMRPSQHTWPTQHSTLSAVMRRVPSGLHVVSVTGACPRRAMCAFVCVASTKLRQRWAMAATVRSVCTYSVHFIDYYRSNPPSELGQPREECVPARSTPPRSLRTPPRCVD